VVVGIRVAAHREVPQDALMTRFVEKRYEMTEDVER
jgi:hypothetical protein